MQVQLPPTDTLQRATFIFDGGEINVDTLDTVAEVELPEGVDEQAVTVTVVALGSNGQPVGEPSIVQSAVELCGDDSEDEPVGDDGQPASDVALTDSVEASLESTISLGADEPEIVSPFGDGPEKKGGPFRGPQAKGL